MNRVRPIYRPLAAVQLLNEIAQSETKRRQYAESQGAKALERLKQTEQELKKVDKFRKKMEAKKKRGQHKAKKHQARAKKRRKKGKK